MNHLLLSERCGLDAKAAHVDEIAGEAVIFLLDEQGECLVPLVHAAEFDLVDALGIIHAVPGISLGRAKALSIIGSAGWIDVDDR